MESTLKDVIRPGIKRGLDFVVVDELRKRTGVSPEAVLKFAMAEMMCNSLDTDATEINIRITTEPNFCVLEVSDNGTKKLSLKDIEMVLDFESKASSKRGLFMVSRGYLGNALKCIFGYSYALAESKGLAPPNIVVKSGSYEYRIALKPDRIEQVIKSEVVTAERIDNGWTTFIVKIPLDYVDHAPFDKRHPSSPNVLKDIIFASSMVNPTRKITYDLTGYTPWTEKGGLGSKEEAQPIRKETSVLWYNEKQFQALFDDYIRVRPETQLKEFIPLFRGFTSKKIIGEILQKIIALNHDLREPNSMQFFPATPMKDLTERDVSTLLTIMKSRAKQIPRNKRAVSSVYGRVGKEAFERVSKENGWKNLRYDAMVGMKAECPVWSHTENPCSNIDHVEFPYLVELAVFDREDDGEGLKVFQCVNFSASMEDIFARIYHIQYHLGRVGISPQTPVTVVAHLICPVLKWLNYGKSGLDE